MKLTLTTMTKIKPDKFKPFNVRINGLKAKELNILEKGSKVIINKHDFWVYDILPNNKGCVVCCTDFRIKEPGTFEVEILANMSMEIEVALMSDIIEYCNFTVQAELPFEENT